MRQITDLLTLSFLEPLQKCFETFSQDVINECRTAFSLPLVADIMTQKINFLVRYYASKNLVCKVFAQNAECEINALRVLKL